MSIAVFIPVAINGFFSLKETERIKIMQLEDTYTLVISKVLTSDGGEVQMKATNEEGEAACSAKLFVTEDIV